MRFLNYIIVGLLIAMPINVYAGAGGFVGDTLDDPIISAYYDLRERSTFIQVTNVDDSLESCRIHVQIFQHDRECSELNFYDTLTPNDTVIYDLDNLLRNDGSPVPANLDENSYGYVSVIGDIEDGCELIIGNFRIIDNAGYEYRVNMPEIDGPGFSNLYANFNTIDGANQADVVGYSYFLDDGSGELLALNNDFGFDADIFVFDFNEEPLSCDRRNFACGNVMNYGVNEDYPNSRSGPLLCPGGGLADPDGGFIHFDNWNVPPDFVGLGILIMQGFIGINNGDGTGSMDQWFTRGD